MWQVSVASLYHLMRYTQTAVSENRYSQSSFRGTKAVLPPLATLGKYIVCTRQQQKVTETDNSKSSASQTTLPCTWYLKGVSMNVPSTCQPVRPTPVHPSAGSLDTRNMSGWGERGCFENVLSTFPSVAENSTFHVKTEHNCQSNAGSVSTDETQLSKQ